MVEPRTSFAGQTPVEISYLPVHGHRLLPVEVLQRSDVLQRTAGRSRQRAMFHQLVVCTSGEGTHNVDFESIPFTAGSMIRIHPGQVQQFVTDAAFEATMVVWPDDSHYADPQAPAWYPGSDIATRWQLDTESLTQVLGWIEELRVEQAQFDTSAAYASLLQTLLRSLLIRLAIMLPQPSQSANRLPRPYLDYREMIEARLYDRPSVLALAHDLGYSSRTLDRACKTVSGNTAKEVLDERTTLEIRRLLTHTTRPIAQVGHDLGFGDPSNFSKFVKRHLGQLPGQIRNEMLASVQS